MFALSIFKPSSILSKQASLLRSLSSTASSASIEGKSKSNNNPVIIEAAQKNISQSPWKMRFLVTLARGKWLPEALAQMKFSPKRRSDDISKILNRGAAVAKIYHSAIPEELFVKEIYVNKGATQKRMRIMGRGRTGFGYRRQTHVIAKLEIIDFEDRIAKCETANQRIQWQKRRDLVSTIKEKEAANSTVVEEITATA